MYQMNKTGYRTDTQYEPSFLKILDFWTLWEVRVGCFERTASKHVYYLG